MKRSTDTSWRHARRGGRWAAAVGAFALATGLVVAAPTTAQAAPAPLQWTTPGQHSWTVPAGVTEVRVDITGGAGGNGPVSDGPFEGGHWGGRGERLQGVLTVTPGEQLTIFVGARGTDGSPGGGGDSGGAGGQGWQAGGAGGSGSISPFFPTYGQGGGGGGGSSYIGGANYRADVHVGGGGGAGGFAACGGNPGGDAGSSGSKVSSNCTSDGGDPGAHNATTGAGAPGENAGGGSGQGGGGGGGGGYRGGGGADASTDGGGGGGGGTSWYAASRFTLESRSYGNHGSHGRVVLTPVYGTQVELDRDSYTMIPGGETTIAGTVGYPGSTNPGIAPQGTVHLESGTAGSWTTVAVVGLDDGTFTFGCDADCAVGPADTLLRATYLPGDAAWRSASATADFELVPGQTRTTLEVDPVTTVTGQERELRATVDVQAPASGDPDGAVEFWAQPFDGGSPVLLGTSPLQGNGQTSLDVVTPFQGEHRVRAVYPGSAWYDGSSSGWSTVRTDPAPTTVTAHALPEPSTYGEDFLVQVVVESTFAAAGVPDGDVEVVVDGVPHPATLNQGTVTVPVAGGHEAGTLSVRVRYLGSERHRASEVEVTHDVVPGQVELVLAQDAPSSRFGEPVRLSVLATHLAPAVGDVSGEVEIWVDGEASELRGTLEGSRAELELEGLDVGEHTLEARFAGSTSSAPAVSEPLGHEVVASGTLVTLTPDRGTMTVGTAGVLRVDVVAETGADVPVAGVVDVHLAGPDGPVGEALGSGELVEGTAQVVLDGLAVGDHELVAHYRGSESFAAGLSAPRDLEVVPAASATELGLPPLATAGESVTVTAQVTTRESALSAHVPGTGLSTQLLDLPLPGSWVPFVAPGQVQLYVDGEPVGDPVELRPAGAEEPGVATATWDLELEAGARLVEAEYLGAETVQPSRAPAAALVVSAGPPGRGPGQLPRTGTAPELVLLSAILTGAGLVLVVARRRLAG